MPIEVMCATCGHLHRVKEELLGRKIRCKQCDEPMEVTDELAPPPVRRSSNGKARKSAPKAGTPAWIPVAGVVALIAIGGVIYALAGGKNAPVGPQAGGAGTGNAGSGRAASGSQTQSVDPILAFEKRMSDTMKNLTYDSVAPDGSSLEPFSYVVIFSGVTRDRESNTKELGRSLSTAASSQFRKYKKLPNGGSRVLAINGMTVVMLERPLFFAEDPPSKVSDRYYFKVAPLPGSPEEVLKSLGFGTLESFDPQQRILRIRVDALPGQTLPTMPDSDGPSSN